MFFWFFFSFVALKYPLFDKWLDIITYAPNGETGGNFIAVGHFVQISVPRLFLFRFGDSIWNSLCNFIMKNYRACLSFIKINIQMMEILILNLKNQLDSSFKEISHDFLETYFAHKIQMTIGDAGCFSNNSRMLV